MKFTNFLNENIDYDWKDYYINYDLLKYKIHNIIKNKPNSQKEFIKTLDEEWLKYKKFIDTWLNDFDEKNLNKEKIIPIIKMNHFMQINQEVLKKIITKHDKNSNIILKPSWDWKINYKPFYKMFSIIKDISNLYQEEEVGESKINNQNFVRQSAKYWVKKENIVPLICQVIPHLPIYIFDEDIDDHIYQMISSVYFDNKELDICLERLDKRENAKLIRIRYYGNNQDNLFIERKVHHENWTQKDSSKDRFILNSSKIMSYMRGDFQVDSNLGREIQETILDRELYPKLRTIYKRIAFQLKNTNEVRLSLDIDLKMIKENTTHFDWITPEKDLIQSDIYDFPFAVLEVKLQGDYVENPPDWIKNIINSDLVISQPYFSKYIHGAYMFFNQNINKIPHWINNNMQYFDNQLKKDVVIDIDNSPFKSSPKRNKSNCLVCFQKPEKNVSVPLKVEPKTFFANERTYLQWFNAAILMASIGMAVFTAGEKEIGIVLNSLGFSTLLYSMNSYRKRNWALKNKIAMNYQDEYGPYLLSFGVITSFIVSIIIKF